MGLCTRLSGWAIISLLVTCVASQTGDHKVSSDTNEMLKDRWTYDVGDPLNCPVPSHLTMEVLPGIGWDNLQNLHMGQVLDFGYSKCSLTSDRKFLIPDDVVTIPLKKSNVHVTSKLMTHFSKYTSVTSYSINANLNIPLGKKFFPLSGSFSFDHLDAKMQMSSEKTVANRVDMRYVFYTIKSQPDHKLHPTFKYKLLDIASFLQSNDESIARYLTSLLIRDFGTHCITSVDAGGVLVKEDHLDFKETMSTEENKLNVKVSATLSFLAIFNIAKLGFTYSTDTKKVEEYMSKCKDTKVVSYGGPSYRADFSLDRWVDDLENNLVAVDMDGVPLYHLITPGALPELPIQTVLNLASFVEEEAKAYYKHNLYPGCTDSDDENFSFIANVDDGTCKESPNNYTFGGVYQTCKGDFCKGQTQVNPKTGGYSCPANYKAFLLHRITVTQYHEKCKHILFWKHCHHWTAINYDITIYWCAATGHVAPESGYLFGGVFTTQKSNLFTGSKGCPDAFLAIPLGHDQELSVCISDDYEIGSRFSVPFAGFFSCKNGNPLATHKGSNLPRRCPEGFSQHLWAINNGCEIDYCTKSNVLTDKELPKINRPPFSKTPKIFFNSTRLLITSMDRIMMKKPDAEKWELTNLSANAKMSDVEELINASFIMPSHPVKEEIISEMRESTTSSSLGMTVALSIVSTALVGVVILFIIVIGLKNRKSSVPYQQVRSLTRDDAAGYGSLEGVNLRQGEVPASSTV